MKFSTRKSDVISMEEMRSMRGDGDHDIYKVFIVGFQVAVWKNLPDELTRKIMEYHVNDGRAWRMSKSLMEKSLALWSRMVPYESARFRHEMFFGMASTEERNTADFDTAWQMVSETDQPFPIAYAMLFSNPIRSHFRISVPRSYFWHHDSMLDIVTGCAGNRVSAAQKLLDAIKRRESMIRSLKICLLMRVLMSLPGTAAQEMRASGDLSENEAVKNILTLTLVPLLRAMDYFFITVCAIYQMVFRMASHVGYQQVLVCAVVMLFWLGFSLTFVRFVMPFAKVLFRIIFRRSFTLKTVDHKQAPLEPKSPALSVKLVTPRVQIEEMAMPGSALCASVRRPVGAIMVANEDTELQLVGCFFRYKDWLVTAKHVANQVSSGLADIYLSAPEVTARGSTKLNLTKVVHVEKTRFELDENLFSNQSLDVFVMKLTAKEWTRLNLSTVHLKKATRYKQTISSAGYVNGVLQSGSGVTGVVKHTHLLLSHTASTLPGFSGSPIFSGTSVVGVHISGSKSENWLVRMEVVIHFLPRDEYSSSYYASEYSDSYKDRDEDLDVFREDDDHFGVSRNGRMKFLDEDELAKAGYDLTDKVHRTDTYSYNAKQGRMWADDDDEDDYYGYHYRKNENAILDRNKEQVASRIRPAHSGTDGPDASQLPIPTMAKVHVIRKSNVAPVHGNTTPSDNSDIVSYFDDTKQELVSLGFVQDEYSWPELNPKVEEQSLIKHLEMFAKEQPLKENLPTADEMERCVNICLDMLKSNRFEPKVGYKSHENLATIINSNLVGANKSAGRPYQAEGMPTNGDVIKNVGVDGLINLVHERWLEKVVLKVFPKGEPNKLKKIQKQMIRVVTGFPLHKMVKNQAIFRESLNTAVESWKTSPIKYAFNPGLPGHIEHLASCFKNMAVEEADKSNWDFHMYKYIFDMCKQIHVRLAVKPSDMSDEEFDEWKTDAEGAYDEVYKSIEYACTNGRVYESSFEGIMKSGWLCTIFANSVGQLVLHVMIMMRSSQSDAQIKDPANTIVAGGDDTLNSFKSKSIIPRYILEAEKLGFPIEFKHNDKFEGCEFFSNHFKIFRGMWGYEPVRFTKHIEKMRKLKKEHLAPALSCALINYCWKVPEFKYFTKMFTHFRKTDPEAFPLHFVIDQRAQQYKCKGLELANNARSADYTDLDECLDSFFASD